MKNKIIFCLLAFFLTFTISFTRVSAVSNNITNEQYKTYIVGLEGELVSSSSAYEGVNVLNFGFDKPEDIFIDDNDDVYVADSSTKSILKYDLSTKEVKEYGKGILEGPTGVYVSNDLIYVADSISKNITILDNNNNLVKKIGRPTSDLFGKESFYQPSKIAVDQRGNLYVTSIGNSNGVLQMNSEGEFVGYFGPNQVKVSFSLLIKRLFMSKEDRELYASLTPKPTTNLTIDNKNIVYTLVDGIGNESLKKYNVNGTNLLGGATNMSTSYRDVAVDNDGYIYTVSNDNEGTITVRNPNGETIFMFGNTTKNSFNIGNFEAPTGIDVDSKGNIWLLDGAGKNIQVFTKTKFASTIFDAFALYNDGKYDEAEVAYKDIVSKNSSFLLAYIGLGQINQRKQNYHEALDYFKIANFKSGYSEAFWEIRDEWIGKNLIWMISVIIVLVLLNVLKVRKRVFAHYNIDLSEYTNKIKNNSYYKEFSYLPKMLRKPKDTIYDIKFLQRIRVSTAFIFFALFVLINVVSDLFITSYLFRSQLESHVNISFELLKWGLILPLIVIANHLVSSLQKGEGFLRDIFIGALVSFAPVLIFKVPIAILSNVLTYNESYIYSLLTNIVWIWSICNFIYMIKEVQNYKIGELIVNIVLTFLAVMVLVFLYLMIYILFMQMFDFISGLIKEAMLR